MRLYLEFLQAISRINIHETLGSDYPEFQNEVTYINFVRARIIGVLCVFIFIILTGFDVHFYLSGRWELSSGYCLLFYSHCAILVVFGLFLMADWKTRINRAGDVRGFHKRMSDVLMFSALCCMVMISYADVLISGSIAAYLGSIFAIAAIFLLPNTYCAVLFLPNMVLMASLIYSAPTSQSASIRIQLINAVSFTLLAMALSRMLYYYHVKDFRNRRLIRIQRERLEEVSRTDHLTQAVNRRCCQEIAIKEIASANRHRTPLSLAIIDLDHFKSVNDTFGHCAGDTALVEFSDVVRQNIRELDTFVRWGGEEFLILSLQTDLDGMALLAEKIRQVVELHGFSHESQVTASFGVTQYRLNETWDEFIQRCDKALYHAKQNGRNRVKILP